MCCCEFLSYVEVQETFCPFEVKFSAAAMFRCTSAALSRVQTPCLLANLLLFHGHQISCSHFKVSHESFVVVGHCKRSVTKALFWCAIGKDLQLNSLLSKVLPERGPLFQCVQFLLPYNIQMITIPHHIDFFNLCTILTQDFHGHKPKPVACNLDQLLPG